MYKFILIVLIVLAILAIACGVFFGLTTTGQVIWNQHFHTPQIDDSISEETRNEVESKCRAMIASWEADVLIYNQYKDSDSAEHQGWAEQAKVRANQTASVYNQYMFNNSYVWQENIPSDIYAAIAYIED